MIPARAARLSHSSTVPTTDKPIACLSQFRAYQSVCNSLTDDGVPEFIIYLCDDIDIALAVYTYDGKGCATYIGQSSDGKVMCLFSAIGAVLAIQLTQTGLRLTQKSISSISQEPKVPILVKMTVSIGISRQMLI